MATREKGRARIKTLRSNSRFIDPIRSLTATVDATTDIGQASGELITGLSRSGHVRTELHGARPGRVEPQRNALVPGALVGGRFILIQEIGRGSTGIVFEMRHHELGHRVAIKALHPHIADNPNVMWRFKREAQLTASLKHPNIVSIFDVGQQFDSIYFIVQEFLDGVSLRRLLQQQGQLSISEALDYLVPIMGALVAAHEKSIIHRDVKPENIFLAQLPSGTVVPKLIDFGLAKIATEKSEFETQIGAVLGTPSYMSPEQALGEKVDTQADVWSIGVIFFEVLSGERPFYTDAVSTALERVRRGDPKPLSHLAPHVPTELANIVHRALDRDLSRRFSSMFDFLAAIVSFAEKSNPSFSSTHAASIPRALVSQHSSSPDDSEPVSNRGKRALSLSNIRAVRNHSSLPEVDVETMRTAGVCTDMLAEQALELNNLARAIDLAEKAIAEQPTSARIQARMRLIQAIACRWLGRFVEAEGHARSALQRLPDGSSRWFAAVNTLMVVLEGMGKHAELGEIVDVLLRARATQSAVPLGAQVRALSQATISTSRSGMESLANRCFDLAQTLAKALPYDEVDVRVWLDLAEAELGLAAGDHGSFLSLVNLSMETFAVRGDTRNACYYRAEMGCAYLDLGAYSRAERELRSAINLGEPIRLDFLVPIRVKLAFALARMGRFREATAVSLEVLKECIEQGNSPFLPICRVYLAEILRLRNQLPEAEEQAAEAVLLTAHLPVLRTTALATLATIVLQSGHAEVALLHSTRAMGILQSLKSAHPGEAQVRLAHVRALEGAGQRSKARIHLEQARARLAIRAARISDPRWQKTFLEEIPENRETNALEIHTAPPPPS